MHAEELISEDMDRLSVEFEFEVDGQRYLVRRSRGKKQGERDQSLWIWDDGSERLGAGARHGEGGRAASGRSRTSCGCRPMRSRRRSCCSRAARREFIDADPKPRFDIISSLIGLKEYEELEKRARDAGREEKRRLDDLKEKLKAFEGRRRDDAHTPARGSAMRPPRAKPMLRRCSQAATAMLADAQRYSRLAGEIAQLDATIARAAELIAAEGADREGGRASSRR